MLPFEADVAILNPTIDHKTFSIEKVVPVINSNPWNEFIIAQTIK